MENSENYLYSEWLDQLAEKYGDAAALSCTDDTLTFRKIRDVSYRFALSLCRMGGFRKATQSCCYLSTV